MTDGAIKTAGYGLFAYGVASSVYSAWQKSQDGNVLGALLDLAEAGANAYRFMQACFGAGTPLLWEYGSKAIEKFVVGDRVWSRDEFDPYGPLVLKVVEEVFVRTAKILHVHVRGQVIRTTAEHPFFVKRAWAFISAAELQVGDLFVGHDGQWAAVEEVYDSGEYETVYNLRVADFHTYFVGSEEWGFSVWVHNAKCTPTERKTKLLSNTKYGRRATRALPAGQGRAAGPENAAARRFFKMNKKLARQLWEERTGKQWPTRNGKPVIAEHTRPLKEGGDPLNVEPIKYRAAASRKANDPHMIKGSDGLSDQQRWGALGGLTKARNAQVQQDGG